MKLRELKSEFSKILENTYTKREAESLFFIFLEEYLKIKRIDYLSKPEEHLSELELDRMNAVLHLLKSGEPYQHILGNVPFAGLSLKVSRSALIPRPETEELVYLLRDKYGRHSPENVLDIGTGTGCMALACKSFFPNAEVKGVDVLQPTLELARENANRNKLKVDFIKADFLKSHPAIERQWELIISNPPYIAMEEYDTIEGLVKNHEPLEALFVEGDDPLLFYKRIAEFGKDYLKQGGYLYLEINEKLGPPTLEVFQSQFYRAELVRDMSGKERFIVAERT